MEESFIIRIPKFTKVQKAFAIYWDWLHEVKYEHQENAHPSWKGYTQKRFSEIREIENTMTEEEKQEFSKKATFYKVIGIKK